MDDAWVKQGLFEIIAILRESVKKGSRVDVRAKARIIATRILRLDSAGFFIPWSEELIKEGRTLSFTIQDYNAKYDFKTGKAKAITSKGVNCLYVAFPGEVNVTQRRKHLRLFLANKHQFYCSGRFNDGLKYHYIVKDISHGGCALIVENDERVASLCGSTLRNAAFDFGDVGTLISDLHVINVKRIKEIADDENERFYIHLSCQFKRMNENTLRKLDNIIVKLLLEEKRLRRL
ncbi:inner membrane protein [Trabulsiella guamensis ATCC 49490]|uniref:Inner membrane protein n=1 Tax=Trabulsiella guamensis ATCC 49490 TaxID=1005994 RepID=A0A085A7J9_9ENTR|nr:PilZ domain-containing protein [Trabulsiella guamensis]KFC06194.1 inner membrane protein [Trabulsiella guamensis ATCC 49490]